MRFHRDTVPEVVDQKLITRLAERYAVKLATFQSWGYEPHLYGFLFHTNTNPETDMLARWRFLVAGRRGGKSHSGVRDVLFYTLHPEQYKRDYLDWMDSDPWWWIIAKDHIQGRPDYIVWKRALAQAGLVKDKDYTENKQLKAFEFKNGGLVEFKSALDVDKLVGAGLSGVMFAEASKIPNEDAFDMVRPALSDTRGMGIWTTTPMEHDWVWEEGWGDKNKDDPQYGTVEYWSLDNPYFSEEEWDEVKAKYHPILFDREYKASFDALRGKDLDGSWLHYWEELPPRSDLDYYIGVDPSISQRKGADRFVITAIGVSKSTGTAYMIDQWAGHLPFPEQVMMIAQWQERYRPQIIGIDGQAYQEALAQQVGRLPQMPPVVPIKNTGDKANRIIGMSTLFKYERVLVGPHHSDFIEEWIAYDSSKLRPRDDTLDSTHIALQVAGALIAEQHELVPAHAEPGLSAMERAVRLDLERARRNNDTDLSGFDYGDWDDDEDWY